MDVIRAASLVMAGLSLCRVWPIDRLAPRIFGAAGQLSQTDASLLSLF